MMMVMMMMPLFPPVGGRIGGGERETRSTLTLTIQNEIEGVVRVDAAAIARTIGGDFGYGIAAAVAALLLGLAEDEYGGALEHLAAASRHRVGSGGAALLHPTGGVGRRRFDDDDLRQNAARELSRQRVHVSLKGVPSVRAQPESDGFGQRSRGRVEILRVRGDGAGACRRLGNLRAVAQTGRGRSLLLFAVALRRGRDLTDVIGDRQLRRGVVFLRGRRRGVENSRWGVV